MFIFSEEEKKAIRQEGEGDAPYSWPFLPRTGNLLGRGQVVGRLKDETDFFQDNSPVTFERVADEEEKN